MTKRRLLSEKKHVQKRHEEAHGGADSTMPRLSDRLAPAISFYEAHRKAFLTGFTILLILIPFLLAFHIRSFSADIPAADDWARNNVYNAVRANIGEQVRQQYPNLPSQNLQTLVDDQFAKALADPAAGQQIEQQVQGAAAYFRASLKNDEGQTYLLAIDPYQWIRYVTGVIEDGHVGDELRDGQPWDLHMYAPLGTPVNGNLHVWLGATLFRISRAFGSDVSLMTLMFWLPAILASLAVIPAFFIGFRKAGLLGGLFAATLVGVHAGFVGRTPAGFSDTDAYVVLIPLLIMWFFLEAFEADSWDWKRRIAYLLLAGAAFGLLAWAWIWNYFFTLFIYTLIAYLGYILARHLVAERSFGSLASFFRSERFRWFLVMFGGFVASSSIFLLLQGSSLAEIPTAPLLPFMQATTFKAAVQAGSIWPNVFTTVAELNVPSLAGIVNSIGGKSLFFVALMGVLLTMVSKRRLILKDWVLLGLGAVFFFFLLNRGTSLSITQFLGLMAVPVALGMVMLLRDGRGIDVKYAIFLSGWLMASVFTMTQGVRFVLLLIPPFAIAAAIAVGTVYSLLKEWLTARVGFSKLWVSPLLFLALCTLLIAPYAQGYATGRNEAPSMDDGWWNSLTKIRQESAPDAIVNSWWDFGHWFKYVADRGVTFDGASQTTPNAHWIGRALLTGDEKEALAILRMVDCGNYVGSDDVQAALPGHDQYGAIMLTKRIIMLPHAEARQALLDAGISPDAVEGILAHTHCEPPEDYFITSQDMVGKGGVWGHFGGWDFAKADAYERFRKAPQATAVPAMAAKYGWTQEEASQIYYEMQTLPDQNAVNSWISPWPGYGMTSWAGCQYQNGSLLVCPLGIRLGQQQSPTPVLEQFTHDLSLPANASRLLIGFYDAQGRRVGENSDVLPGELLLIRNGTLTTIPAGEKNLGQAFIVDTDNARILMADPANAGSIFTRLFYMEGAGTTAFQKFSDENSVTTGRIIVWKVDWSKLKELGLE